MTNARPCPAASPYRPCGARSRRRGRSRRLGFTVGARNRHAWGTHNHIVQLPGFFVELLTVAEPEKLGTDGFSALFGTFNRLFLKQQEGLSLLILESANAVADVADFRAAKIGVSDAMRFEREAKRPDGSTVKVGFSLAFARDPQAPQIGFAAQQHFPENFWNPAFQQHANTVSGVAGVVLVAENPSDHHIFLSAMSGTRSACHLERRHRDDAARRHQGDGPGRLPQPFRHRAARRFRRCPARRAAISRARSRRADRGARPGGITSASHMGSTVIAPEHAMGATLVFEPE